MRSVKSYDKKMAVLLNMLFNDFKLKNVKVKLHSCINFKRISIAIIGLYSTRSGSWEGVSPDSFLLIYNVVMKKAVETVLAITIGSIRFYEY